MNRSANDFIDESNYTVTCYGTRYLVSFINLEEKGIHERAEFGVYSDQSYLVGLTFAIVQKRKKLLKALHDFILHQSAYKLEDLFNKHGHKLAQYLLSSPEAATPVIGLLILTLHSMVESAMSNCGKNRSILKNSP